jgi:cytochrome b involved in lipid metabolism
MSAAQNGKIKTNDSEKEFIVKHKGDRYDIAKFLQFHPGGRNSVSPYRGRSITEKFLDTNHSPAASYLMREYRLAGTPQDSTVEDLEVLKLIHPCNQFNLTFKAAML